MNKLKKFFVLLSSYPKRHYILTSLAIILISGGYYYFNKSSQVSYDYVEVQRGDLVQEVNVTGKVKPASKVNLAFESTGKVSRVFVDVGDKVSAGEKVAQLNSDQYSAQYYQALASLEAEQSRLEDLENGTRPEEIAIQEVKVENAKQSLQDSKKSLVDKVKDAYTKSDDAIRNKSDQLFNNARSSGPDLIFSTDYEIEIEVEDKRAGLETVLDSWNNNLKSLSVDSDNLENYYLSAKSNLDEVSYFLNILALAVNGLKSNSNFSQATIDGYKTDIAAARTNINTAISALSTADEKLKTAESTLSLEEKTLTLKKAGATIQQIDEQKAKVKSAEANVDNYKALIAKTIIYTPIGGIVTKVDIEKGETAQLNTPIIIIISGAEFEIEANIPEADIAKVKVGDNADVTLDAYEESDVFNAKIISIEPAETIVEGVPTYKTTFQFIEKDQRIFSGMTANIDIQTGFKENVLNIPSRLLRINGSTHVDVLEGENIVQKDIEVGMKSTDGRVEVVSGLREGDKVIITR